MKKIFKVLLASVFMLCCASAFAAKKSIVCVTYPEYDWVMNILGKKASNFNVSLLQKNGTDLHSYQPSVKDIASISSCDMLVYVGGESDEWVEKTLSNAKNKNMVVVNMMEVLGDKVKEEEFVEGMEAEHQHEHQHAEFDEKNIQDRSLADFAGEWTSAYVWLKEGKLNHVIKHQAAEDESKTEADQRAYYETGFKTDIDGITIKGSNVSFVIKGKSVKAKYEYAGYRIVKYSNGNTGVRYMFQANGKTNGAPKYIGFNDHNITKSKAAHYHFYSSNKSIEDMCKESDNWPTYYPAHFGEEEIDDAFLNGHGHSHEEEEEYDEHVWLSLKNAVVIVNHLSEKIQKLDSANAGVYKSNAASYVKQLSDLDREFERAVAASSKKTVLFGDRFPFRYLVDDYGLSYFAAFVGCSAETEASFETIAFLAKKVDELGLKSILTIERSDKKIAKTISSNTKSKNQDILEMDSLQTINDKDIKSGRNYLSAMKANLEVLKKALR